MIELKLPSWFNSNQVSKLAAAAASYWVTVETWMRWPLLQLDVDTCTLGMLDLIAWQRNISRFKDESESLYRLRVKYAFINEQDAGNAAGIKRIFERLGVGYVEVEERVAGQDWDIIRLHLSEGQLSQNQALLARILEKYGRTCRRYDIQVVMPVALGVSAHEFSHEWHFDHAQ